mmetsp:Transcript_2502/g.11117  ORF Transcript_2502/g.11117 Transcript_2502/m.11117 type:complete len:201 (-) Transcript_2502:8-610(-)
MRIGRSVDAASGIPTYRREPELLLADDGEDAQRPLPGAGRLVGRRAERQGRPRVSPQRQALVLDGRRVQPSESRRAVADSPAPRRLRRVESVQGPQGPVAEDGDELRGSELGRGVRHVRARLRQAALLEDRARDAVQNVRASPNGTRAYRPRGVPRGGNDAGEVVQCDRRGALGDLRPHRSRGRPSGKHVVAPRPLDARS